MKKIFCIAILIIIGINMYSLDRAENIITLNPIAYPVLRLYELEYVKLFNNKLGISISPRFSINEFDDWKVTSYGGKIGLILYQSKKFPRGSNMGLFFAGTYADANYYYDYDDESKSQRGRAADDVVINGERKRRLTTNSFFSIPGMSVGYNWIIKKHLLINVTSSFLYVLGKVNVTDIDDDIDEGIVMNDFTYDLQFRIGYSW